jgi:hypothetical protein
VDSIVVTDGGREIGAPKGFVDEAEHCFADSDREHRIVLIRPGEYPGLRGAAVHLLQATFLEKDGVRPDSFAQHLADLEPQHFALVLKRGPAGPVPVGALQLAIQERRPPESVSDIRDVFGVDVAELCARTVTPGGDTLPNLMLDFHDVAGIEAVAVWPEYRDNHGAPYAYLLYAQAARYLRYRGIRFVSAILDVRRGEVFSQLQAALGNPFINYGLPIRPRVYWTEGVWAHLSNQEVPLDADGQPLVQVPNLSAPAYMDLPGWLDRLALGSDRDRKVYNRIVGDGLLGYTTFDPSFEPVLAGTGA